MRQYFTYAIIFGGALLGYLSLKDKITFAPNIGTAEDFAKQKQLQNQQLAQNAAKAPTQNFVHTKNLSRKETRHESKRHFANPNAQRTRHREDEGSSISADEIESIASIYQDQEGQREQQPESAVSATNNELPKSRPISPIPGVKVAAWVRSNSNHLKTDVPDPRIGAGMRVFVNCVELKKKGASPLEQRECDRVLAKKDTVEKTSNHFE